MSFNLSAWALQNRQIVLYLMILLGAVGALSYSKLGQSEDPPFTFKAMVVQTNWPGASAEEVARQVTERIEKKLMETGDYDRIVSFSRPGVSQVTFMAREDIHSSEIPELWYQIRKKISDIRATLPQSIQGPFFNDEFGTTYGNIYALTGKGFDYAVMKDYADRLQLQLQRIRNVGKVELIGLQDEKIWIDLSNTKLATLGLPLAAVQKALEEQNAVASSGFFETASDRVQLRVSGRFDSVEEIRDFPIRVGDRTFRIGDVAEVRRGFNDPPAPRMRFMGEDAIALVVSWFAAVVFVPYLGAKLLPDLARLHAQKHGGSADGYDPYATAFYQRFRRLVEWCVRYRKTVIVLTLAAFVGALLLFRLVPQQFFPPSARLELLLDIKLAEGASLRSTGEEVQRLEKMLQGHDGIDNYVAYVGTGSPRFYLPLDQQLPAASFAQVVVLAKDLESREALRKWLIERMNEDFPHLRSRISRLENGPPVGYPVQFRVSGEDIPQVRELARKVADKMRENPHVVNVHLDWEEPSKVVYLSIDQERARALGVSTASLSQFLQSALTGSHVSFFREDNELIEILLRGTEQERRDLSLLPSLAVPTENGRSVALSQIATLEYGFEEGIIWHRNRLPTVTVRADIYDDSLPATLVAQIAPTLEPIRAELPDGYLLEVGGTVEDAAKGQSSVNAGVPLFIVVVLSLLMVQLRSFSRMAMVFLTAPLGLIGVTLFLLLFRQPFGFVAMLGTIALAGMIMRNSVILVDQIEQDISHGLDRWHAIIEATVRRFRPIVLTALAAVLAMIPLSRSVFFGPMAVAIMGGLIVATVLTLLFLPALYAAWFRVKKDEARA
ncbi:efflux RND transporter permease subunit [Pseudomonas aeruginosa]|uniref:efflux RND transporter permease subunit n=1 Tax=Pseudomonas aeruginosa TaxID=287 RepID=UPI0021199D30|nr:efflux RND transporter permease subunit [Pseudomonas aeruginosa]